MQHHDAPLLVGDRARVRGRRLSGRSSARPCAPAVRVTNRRESAETASRRTACETSSGSAARRRSDTRSPAGSSAARAPSAATRTSPHASSAHRKPPFWRYCAQRRRFLGRDERAAVLAHHHERALEQLGLGRLNHDVIHFLVGVEVHRRARELGEANRQVLVRARVVDAPAAAVAVRRLRVRQAAEREVAVPGDVFGPLDGPEASAAAPPLGNAMVETTSISTITDAISFLLVITPVIPDSPYHDLPLRTFSALRLRTPDIVFLRTAATRQFRAPTAGRPREAPTSTHCISPQRSATAHPGSGIPSIGVRRHDDDRVVRRPAPSAHRAVPGCRTARRPSASSDRHTSARFFFCQRSA